MVKVEFLYLSQQDVIDAGLTLKDAVDIVEGVFREHGAGHYENPPKPGIHTRPDAFIHAMPGYLPGKGVSGMKWVSGYPGNQKLGLPTIIGMIVLNDVDTGLPVAVMDGTYITALRTAAASGVSARYLANRDAKILGLVAAGVQGRYNLLILNEVLPEIQLARVFDTNPRILERFVADMDGRLPFRVETCRSAQEVIEGADVVVTSTGRLDRPVFKEEWVGEGALVLPVHTQGWETAMLYQADKLIVDDEAQFRKFAGPPDGFYEALPEVDGQLGEVILGRKPGREKKSERIVNFNPGIAIHDMAMAIEVLARARANGLGSPLVLIDGELPFT